MALHFLIPATIPDTTYTSTCIKWYDKDEMPSLMFLLHLCKISFYLLTFSNLYDILYQPDTISDDLMRMKSLPTDIRWYSTHWGNLKASQHCCIYFIFDVKADLNIMCMAFNGLILFRKMSSLSFFSIKCYFKTTEKKSFHLILTCSFFMESEFVQWEMSQGRKPIIYTQSMIHN